MMELARGYRAKSKIKHLDGGGSGLNSDALLVIKLPDWKVLRVIARSLFLAMVIVTLPFIGPIFRGSSDSYVNADDFGSDSDWIDFELVHLLFRDLADEGLIKRGDKALIVGSGIGGNFDNLQFLTDNEVDVVMESDSDRQSSIPDETFDFAFASSFQNAKFVDRVVKIGGIVAVPLSNYPSNALTDQSIYEIVYLRRFDTTIVAMRKSGPADDGLVSFSRNRRLCALASEVKKVALKGLEDVLLEPPRRALAKSNKYLKKFKYLPDLLGDSLEGYNRRIFVNVGLMEENRASTEWFYKNYPTKNQDFDIYNLETAMEESSSSIRLAPQIGISDWLKKNVREDEYVVMKAEAELVEDMIKAKAICLVDELFLDCKNQWQDGKKKNKKSRRAYWECLALYGRLRDEGVAVHQWWG